MILLRRIKAALALFYLPIILSAHAVKEETKQQRPNIVLLMADDLGYGDVGCFGNDTIRTPNIDSIAKDGVKLTQHAMPDSVCTPNRAAFMTSRLPIRYGLASGRNVVWPRMILSTAFPIGLPQNETTLAEVLKDVGYTTGLIGKWHLGLNYAGQDNHFHPLKQGFDYFYGLPLTNLRDCGDDGRSIFVRAALHFTFHIAVIAGILVMTFLFMKHLGIYDSRGFIISLLALAALLLFLYNFNLVSKPSNCILMKNYDIIQQPLKFDNLTPSLAKQAVSFVEKNQQKPFFLFMSFVKVHTVLFTTEKFKGVSKHGEFGDNVEEMDWAVGEILKALEQYGLRENTFVYFTSDNGGHVEEIGPNGEAEGGWNGGLKGGKGQTWEGGIRMPTVAMFPGRIPAGKEISEPTSAMDVFPTVANIVGGKVPDDREIDGKDMMPLLLGKKTISPHEFMYHYCGKYLHAIRYRPQKGLTTYKAYFTTPNWTPGTQGCFSSFRCGCTGDDFSGNLVTNHDPPLIFDMTSDPYETTPLSGKTDPNYQAVLDVIRKAREHHESELVPGADQMTLLNQIYRPWLQPCCSLPFCSCDKVNDKSP